jgi:hypothetical protein
MPKQDQFHIGYFSHVATFFIILYKAMNALPRSNKNQIQAAASSFSYSDSSESESESESNKGDFQPRQKAGQNKNNNKPGLPLIVQEKLWETIEENGGLLKANLEAICNRDRALYGHPKSKLRRQVQNKVAFWKKTAKKGQLVPPRSENLFPVLQTREPPQLLPPPTCQQEIEVVTPRANKGNMYRAPTTPRKATTPSKFAGQQLRSPTASNLQLPPELDDNDYVGKY